MTLLQTVYEMMTLQMTSLSFLFVVLPIFLLAYYLTPGRARPAALLVISLLYYLMVESPGHLLLMMASVCLDYLVLRLMARWDEDHGRRQICMWFSVVKSLAIILYFGAMVQIQSTPQTLGLQIYTLSAMGCVVAAYKRQQSCTGNLLQFGLHCCFFPKLHAGPLVPWEGFADQIADVQLDPYKVMVGLGQFVQGVFKAAVLGGSLYSLYGQVSKINEPTTLSSWCVVFAIAFSLYFLLSGFSDIAQGLGAMFGLTLPRNFYYPYQSRNVADFFDRFNITVGRFIRRMVYVPLQGGENGKLADAINILLAGMLMGLWFGLRLNYLVWGMYLAVFVIMERYVYPKMLARTPTLFARALTLCIVLSSFTIFSGDSLLGSLQLIRSMLDFRTLVNDEILYLLSSNWLLLLLSCFLATNAVNLTVTKFRRAAPTLAAVILGVLDLGILVMYVALAL